jgi:hypothetical protein
MPIVMSSLGTGVLCQIRVPNNSRVHTSETGHAARIQGYHCRTA